jgi:membrane protein insertase Oxa1/YidC/SpoIIIJ
MYVMPLMFSVFLIALPSGLVLYILVNSLLTILQQLAINSRKPAV